MIKQLLDVIPQGNRKYPIRYRRAMNVIYSRLDYLKFRFLGMDMTNSPGLELLKSILLNVDLTELDSYPSDIDRFTYYIQFYKTGRLAQFDPVYSGKFTSGYFTNGLTTYSGVTEVLLDVDTRHPFNTFPLDKDWPDWQDMRGLRVIAHDSFEIPETITSSLITFKQHSPSIIIMTIDVPVLVFKYYKYWKNCQEAEIQCDIYEFLKRYEYANFFGDLLDAWLLNVVSETYMAKVDGKTVNEYVKELKVPTRVATDNVLRELVSGLYEYADLYIQNSLKPQDAIDTPWFPNGQTYREKINDLYEAVKFPLQRNYKWCEALMWLPYIEVITRSLVVFPSSPVANQIAARARTLWRNRYEFANVSSIARGVTVKLLVNDTLDALEIITKQRAHMS